MDWDDDDGMDGGEECFRGPFYGDREYEAARNALIPEAAQCAYEIAMKIPVDPSATSIEARDRHNNVWNAAFHAKMNQLAKEKIYAKGGASKGVPGTVLEGRPPVEVPNSKDADGRPASPDAAGASSGDAEPVSEHLDLSCLQAGSGGGDSDV